MDYGYRNQISCLYSFLHHSILIFEFLTRRLDLLRAWRSFLGVHCLYRIIHPKLRRPSGAEFLGPVEEDFLKLLLGVGEPISPDPPGP